ncbi:MAG: hypothetical protein IJF02_06925 [Oscillospiraceae bacterium]|nr:hypothetical protein [Oscillospiraceae bacterium]
MNSDYENNSLSATAMEALIQANGQAVETRQRIPYEMVVYAIPEEWREEEMNLLRHAVQFQPTLYKQIDTLATRQDWQDLLTDQRTVLQTESREMQSSMRRILQQDGSVREKFSSELSGMLSDSLKAMEATTSRLEQKVRKLTRISVAASMVASALVCVVWHLLAG